MLEKRFHIKIQVIMIIKFQVKKSIYQQMEECLVWLVEMLKEMFYNNPNNFNQQLEILPKIIIKCNKTLKD